VKAAQLKRAGISCWQDQLLSMLNPTQELRDLSLVKQLLDLAFIGSVSATFTDNTRDLT